MGQPRINKNIKILIGVAIPLLLGIVIVLKLATTLSFAYNPPKNTAQTKQTAAQQKAQETKAIMEAAQHALQEATIEASETNFNNAVAKLKLVPVSEIETACNADYAKKFETLVNYLSACGYEKGQIYMRNFGITLKNVNNNTPGDAQVKIDTMYGHYLKHK